VNDVLQGNIQTFVHCLSIPTDISPSSSQTQDTACGFIWTETNAVFKSFPFLKNQCVMKYSLFKSHDSDSNSIWVGISILRASLYTHSCLSVGSQNNPVIHIRLTECTKHRDTLFRSSSNTIIAQMIALHLPPRRPVVPKPANFPETTIRMDCVSLSFLIIGYIYV